jgi:ATP-dependent DNA helicase RecG
VATSADAQIATGPITFRDLHLRKVEELRGVGEKRTADLHKRGINSILDLLMAYPRRWVDRTHECRLKDLQPGVEAMVLVEVRSVNKRMTKNRRSLVTAVVGDGSSRLTLTFFNQPYREKQLREGLTISVFGKADEYRGSLQMTNPVVDLIGDRTGRIVPIYPQSEEHGIKTWEFAGWVENALSRCEARGILDPLPESVIADLGLLPRHEALRNIHMPDTMETKEAARRRLAFDELLRVQLVLVGRKHQLEREALGISHSTSQKMVEQFIGALPFPLTSAQQRAITEISQDLVAGHPMHRLLQGDVGSGKTVVAVAALLQAVEGGYQGALMAPTEVLTEQHASGVRKLLEGIVVTDAENLFGSRPLRVEMLTNRITGEQRRDVLQGLEEGTVDIIIGTHALIQDAVKFNKLGVVVIDEQHRFGVEQRAALRDKSMLNPQGLPIVPDVLVMTATPIPRTAAMTVYGDLDVSVLDELPPGRTPIETIWASGEQSEADLWAQVREGVQLGQQAFVVCPLIDESEKIEAAAAEDTFQKLGFGELKGLRLGLLHGRMSSQEKETAMETFRRGETDVLVATTVIEVGVDVPNATMMVVLDADRFGIAQLHQLRGRVGRGKIASRCWLVTQPPESGELVHEPGPRVEALVQTTDGFLLAEIDLELRGEGTLMDSRQRGTSDLRLASLRSDRELIEQARATAIAIITQDPTLKKHSELADELRILLTASEEEFLARS